MTEKAYPSHKLVWCPGCGGTTAFDVVEMAYRHVKGGALLNYNYGPGCEERRGTQPDRRKP